jgi:hypothetical protein
MPNRASYVQHIVITRAVEGILAAPSRSTKPGFETSPNDIVTRAHRVRSTLDAYTAQQPPLQSG